MVEAKEEKRQRMEELEEHYKIGRYRRREEAREKGRRGGIRKNQREETREKTKSGDAVQKYLVCCYFTNWFRGKDPTKCSKF